MWREVVTYNSSILVLNVEIKQDNAVVHLSQFIHEPKSNSFLVTLQKKQTIKSLQTNNGSNRISFLGFKVILDHHCGIFLPYFVAQDSKYCHLFCLDSNNEWIRKYKFAVPGAKKLLNTSYSIENGPTLIWIVRNEIFIYKAEYSLNLKGKAVENILRLPVDLTCDKKNLEVVGSILWWNSGRWPYSAEEGMIVFKDSKSRVLNTYHVMVDNEERNADLVLNKPIIPSLYLAITSCTSAIIRECSYKMFVSTTQSQLLEFYKGKYIKHVNIPLSSCENIQIFESPEGDLILVCSQEDQSCAVEWKTSKILKTYQGFTKILIDDFIGLGSSQILLFNCGLKFENRPIFDDFILTDFCKVDVIKSKENKKYNEPSSEVVEVTCQSDESSTDNVVNALMRKVQATEGSVIECKMEKSEKLSFVKRHCESIYNMVINEIASPLMQISGLAELVIGQETGQHKDLPVQSSKIVVRSKWQEITSSQWIIGVEIENVGPRRISDVSLCTVNNTSGTLISSSKMQLLEVPVRNQDEQMLFTGQRATVVAITSLPNFSFESHFTVGLMLAWKHDEEDGYLSQFCGNMTLQMDDVLKSVRRNCQHPAFYHLKTQMKASIASCDINNVVEHLKSNMDTCEYPSSLQKYHLRSPLTTAHMSWTCANNDLVMNIFTSDCNQLFLCLRVMRKQVPDNLTWHLLGNKVALKFAFTSIKNEFRFRISELNIVLKSQRTVRSGSTEDSLASVEEISVKRRKISQLKDGGNMYIDLTMCRKTFLDISSYVCNSENVFLTLLFLQNKSQ